MARGWALVVKLSWAVTSIYMDVVAPGFGIRLRSGLSVRVKIRVRMAVDVEVRVMARVHQIVCNFGRVCQCPWLGLGSWLSAWPKIMVRVMV